MKKEFLDVEQCRELHALGVDMSDASMYYECLPNGSVYVDVADEYKTPLYFTKSVKGVEYIPTYTVTDIVEKLPDLGGGTELMLYRCCGQSSWVAAYEFDDYTPYTKYNQVGETMIDAAFKLFEFMLSEYKKDE